MVVTTGSVCRTGVELEVAVGLGIGLGHRFAELVVDKNIGFERELVQSDSLDRPRVAIAGPRMFLVERWLAVQVVAKTVAHFDAPFELLAGQCYGFDERLEECTDS